MQFLLAKFPDRLQWNGFCKKPLHWSLFFWVCSCQSPPPPLPPKIQLPQKPTIQYSRNDEQYWRSYPGVVLISARYKVGVDTILALVENFSKWYPEENYYSSDYPQPKKYKMPAYLGKKGECMNPQQAKIFFKEQSAKYRIGTDTITRILGDFYVNRNTYRADNQ